MAKRITKGNLWGFIQSRPYATVADIRRLFTMEVDGAAPVRTSDGTYYIGLPQDAADLIRQLWQEGRIILDLNPDVKAKVVQGVYPARVPLGRAAAAGTVPHPALRPPPAAEGGPPGQPDQQPESRRRRRRHRSGSEAAAAALDRRVAPNSER